MKGGGGGLAIRRNCNYEHDGLVIIGGGGEVRVGRGGHFKHINSCL